MRITVTLEVDPADEDQAHRTGLTEAANGKLVDALQRAGFELTSGPTVINPDRTRDTISRPRK